MVEKLKALPKEPGRRLDIGIVPYCPFGRGFLTGEAPPKKTLVPNDIRAGDGRFAGSAPSPESPARLIGRTIPC